MDSGLSGEADQHLGDRSNHHQVRTEVILGSYWNMDWHSEVSMQGRLTSSSGMNSCRRYRADTADNEAVVAPSQSTVWPIVSADTDEDTVYNVTKAIFDNAEAIKGEHAKGAELSIDNATSGMTAPFHKGAARYFAEKGVTVNAQ